MTVGTDVPSFGRKRATTPMLCTVFGRELVRILMNQVTTIEIATTASSAATFTAELHGTALSDRRIEVVNLRRV